MTRLDGISHKVLTDTLRRAERDGLIRRHLDSGRMDTANLYELTDLGRSLEEPLAVLGGGLTPTGTRSKRLSAVGPPEPRVDRERRLAVELLSRHFEVPQLSLKCHLTWCSVDSDTTGSPVAVLDSAQTIGSLRERCSGPW